MRILVANALDVQTRGYPVVIGSSRLSDHLPVGFCGGHLCNRLSEFIDFLRLSVLVSRG